MSHKLHMSCTAGIGQGGLGYHLKFIAQAAYNATFEHPLVYCVNDKPQSGIRVLPREPRWMFLCHYSPIRWFPSAKSLITERHFDRLVSNELPNEPIVYHSFPGCAEQGFKKVHKFGGTTVLEAATTHVNELFPEVQKEHNNIGMGGSPFSSVWRSQVLREYQLADYITVCSELQRDSFLRQGIPAEKLLFTPLGIDTERFSPDKNQTSYRPREKSEKFRIIQVGQVSLLKGFQYVLQALELLHDSNVELVLCGGIGWRAIGELIESYRRRGLTIRNVSGDPLPWLRSSHLCIHSSIQDGFGLAPLEAMATGLPVIVTEKTGMKDAVVHGVSGYTVPPRDTILLAEYIRELKKNDMLRINVGIEARQSALQYDVRTRLDSYAQKLSPIWNSQVFI